MLWSAPLEGSVFLADVYAHVWASVYVGDLLQSLGKIQNQSQLSDKIPDHPPPPPFIS